MTDESMSQTELLQTLHRTFLSSFEDLRRRSSYLNGIAQPTVPLPLDKSTVDLDTLFTRLASALNATGVKLSSPDMSIATFLFLYGKQLAALLQDPHLIGLEPSQAFATNIFAATGQWLSSLLGFWQSKTVTFNLNEIDALAQVCRAAFQWKYDSFLDSGFKTLYAHSPVVYLSEDTLPYVATGLSTTLMLSNNSIRSVPSVSPGGQIDTTKLEELIQEDINQGRSPCLLIARAETPLTGELDDLLALRALCEKHKIWLHLQGSGLAMLALSKLPSPPLTAAITADSVAIRPGDWYHLPMGSSVTFYRLASPVILPSEKLIDSVLPLWLFMQYLGQGHLTSTISSAIDTTNSLVNGLLGIPLIELLPRAFNGQYVLFRFRSEGNELKANIQDLVTKELFASLSASIEPLGIDLVNYAGLNYLRFRPFGHVVPPQPSFADAFVAALSQQCNIFVATLRMQNIFSRLATERRLNVVQLNNFVGLGAVRYVPSFVDPNTLAAQALQDLDELNKNMLVSLREEDARLFSEAIDPVTNRLCITVGMPNTMITENDVANLVDIIFNVAAKVEKTSKFMEDMAEIVRKSIQAAQSDISKQFESEIEDEILRQIPIVGSLYSMFVSPEAPKKQKSGRYFSLPTGKVGNTEEVYHTSASSSSTNISTTTSSPTVAGDASKTVLATPITPNQKELPYVRERMVAIDAVTRASKVCEKVFANLLSDETLTKDDKSPVTVADFAAQAVVHTIIRGAYPVDHIIAEEDSTDLQLEDKKPLKHKVVELVNSTLDTSLTEEQVLSMIDQGKSEGGFDSRFWTLDPIDGTKGFLRGGQYAVCLSLIEKGQVVLSVMGCPNLPVDPTAEGGDRGCLFIAVKDQGAWQRALHSPDSREIRIHVSTVADPTNAVLCESVEAAHSAHNDVLQVTSKLGIVRPSLRLDSQCKYACVARGEATIYLRLQVDPNYSEKIWDHTTGWLLVREAGGLVSDAFGRPLNFGGGRTLQGNSGIIASNRNIYDRLLLTVQEVIHQHSPQQAQQHQAHHHDHTYPHTQE